MDEFSTTSLHDDLARAKLRLALYLEQIAGLLAANMKQLETVAKRWTDTPAIGLDDTASNPPASIKGL